MNPQEDKQIREQLVKHLKGGEAYMTIDAMLDLVNYEDIHMVPNGLPYSFYQVFFHIRLAQHDILEFSRNPAHISPLWPKGYWPKETGLADEQEWTDLKRNYFAERQELCDFLLDSTNDLLKPFSHGSGQNLLREVLLVLEHTSYHTGQLLAILRMIDIFK
jgi:uncharacterized damage-inducible protein DinB